MSGSSPMTAVSVPPVSPAPTESHIDDLDIPRTSPPLSDSTSIKNGSPSNSTAPSPIALSSSSSTNLTTSSIPSQIMFLRSSKRSSSTSNDSVYERDRFRARLYNFNQGPELIDEDKTCDVCDIIGTKTTKLSMKKDTHSSDETLSPMDEKSPFYKSLQRVDFGLETEALDIKQVLYKDLEGIFRWYFNRPLPLTTQMFPWLHGLHADNFAQRQFFIQQHCKEGRGSILDTEDVPKPEARFLMTVSADSNSDDPILKNNTNLSEVLCPIDISRAEVHKLVKTMVLKIFGNSENIDTILEMFLRDTFSINYLPVFLDLDPDRGVSLRNFHIQVSKLAICSDFIVYCFNKENSERCKKIARLIWLAQRFEELNLVNGSILRYNTFILGCGDELHDTKDSDLFSLSLKDKIPSKNYDLNKLVKCSLEFLQNWDSEYIIKEKVETIKMSSATALNGCLYSGNSWDYLNFLNFTYSGKKDYMINKKLVNINSLYCNPLNSITTAHLKSDNLIETILPLPNLNYRMFVSCTNSAHFPDRSSLESLLKLFGGAEIDESEIGDYYYLSFPSSGSIGIGDVKQDNIISILNTCKLIYSISLVKKLDSLIFCSDGYTELSLLILMYIIYSSNCSTNDSIIQLHLKYGRPFYIFNTDVQILKKLEPILRAYSPLANTTIHWDTFEEVTSNFINLLLLSPTTIVPKSGVFGNTTAPSSDDISSDSSASSSSSEESVILPPIDWCKEVDGSLPSRILPYLYLGSLKHASCLPLLYELGINKIISVGECLGWVNGSKFCKQNDVSITELHGGDIEIYDIKPRDNRYPEVSVDQVMKVNNLQDDGISQLESSLPTILEFIDNEYKRSHGQSKILVHCRVGVSRSATVVIAEVMRRLKINLPKAYLYVRVRRLNIIIQPNLKFMYELFKWEETHRPKDSKNLREIDWFAMCREITLLNNPYLSDS